jgi:hypothetical protein
LTRENLLRAARVGLNGVWLSQILGYVNVVTQDSRVRAVVQDLRGVSLTVHRGYDDEESKRRCAEAPYDHRVLCATLLADQLWIPESPV